VKKYAYNILVTKAGKGLIDPGALQAPYRHPSFEFENYKKGEIY